MQAFFRIMTGPKGKEDKLFPKFKVLALITCESKVRDVCYFSRELVNFLRPKELGPSHNTPEKFECATLFLRLGLSSTLIRYENGAFRKRLQTGGI